MKPDEMHLFGPPDAENLHYDLATAYEVVWEANQYNDERHDVTIEEWTTAPLTFNVQGLIEGIAESLAEEGDEWLFKALYDAGQRPDVIAAFQAAVHLMTSKTSYRMAGEKIATHVITHDADDEPMLNGERMYQPTHQKETP